MTTREEILTMAKITGEYRFKIDQFSGKRFRNYNDVVREITATEEWRAMFYDASYAHPDAVTKLEIEAVDAFLRGYKDLDGDPLPWLSPDGSQRAGAALTDRYIWKPRAQDDRPNRLERR